MIPLTIALSVYCTLTYVFGAYCWLKRPTNKMLVLVWCFSPVMLPLGLSILAYYGKLRFRKRMSWE